MLGVPDPLAMEIAQGQDFSRPSFGELAQGIRGEYAQAAIFCPLFGQTDVLTLIELLNDAPFTGKLTVIFPTLPNAKMVAGELKSAAKPTLRIDVLPL